MIEGVFLNSDKFAVLNEKIREIAGKYGVSDTTIATAWILRHPAHMQVLSGTMNLQSLGRSVRHARSLLHGKNGMRSIWRQVICFHKLRLSLDNEYEVKACV